DKGIAVCVGLYLGAINEKLLKRNQAFLLQAEEELVIQFIQHLPGQPFSLKIVKGIPLWLLPLGQPDKSKVSLARFNNAVHSPHTAHVCVGNYSIHHDWVIPGSSLI